MRASAGPSTPTMAVSKASAAAAPASTLRHPRTQPTASTTVSASTHSTSEARNDDTTVVPSQVHAPGSSPANPKCISPLKNEVPIYDRPRATRRMLTAALPQRPFPAGAAQASISSMSSCGGEGRLRDLSGSTPRATTMTGELDRTSRRAFCCGAASMLLARPALLAPARAFGQQTPAEAFASTQGDVAAIDRDRILAAAGRYLTQPPTPLPSLQCARSPGTVHDYYSEATPDPGAGPAQPAAPGKNAAPMPPPFTAHRDALFTLGLAVPALEGAWLLTRESRYAEHAALHLRAWFVDPATSMAPSLNYAHTLPAPDDQHLIIQNNSSFGAAATAPATGHFEGVLETLPLVEVAQAIPFLAASAALDDSSVASLHAWFAAYLGWLTTSEDSGPRLPALARELGRAPGR